jgi:hypothetical protein
MIFKQYKDGSCDIVYSWKERWILFTKGKLHLSQDGLRHFGNYLVKIVSEWNANFDNEAQNKETFVDTKIEGK